MVYTYKDIPKLRKALRGKKVVFVSGCFRILHRGHIECLTKAATFGDALVVGVLADTYIQVKKGDPVQSQKERANLVNALKQVAHAILTPYIKNTYPSIAVIKALRPNVFFRPEKSHMYLPIEKELNDLGITLKAVPMKKVNSTTRIIKKIKRGKD